MKTVKVLVWMLRAHDGKISVTRTRSKATSWIERDMGVVSCVATVEPVVKKAKKKGAKKQCNK